LDLSIILSSSSVISEKLFLIRTSNRIARHFPREAFETSTVRNSVSVWVWTSSAIIIAIGMANEFSGSQRISFLDLADFQYSLPALYEAFLLAWISASILRTAPSKKRNQWAILAIAFAIMAVDKVVNAHALILEPIRQESALGANIATGIPIALAIGLAAFSRPIITSISGRKAMALGAYGLGFLFAATVIDPIPGFAAMEEIGEIIGATGLLTTLLAPTVFGFHHKGFQAPEP
jgi:hypothetical protein